VIAAGIEEGGSKAAIFGCRQSMETYIKECCLVPKFMKTSTKLTNGTIGAAYPRLTDIQNSNADHIWYGNEQGS
jgi:hypothetical protein